MFQPITPGSLVPIRIVARMLSLHHKTVLRKVRQGELRAVKLNARVIRVYRDSIHEYAQRHEIRIADPGLRK